MAENSGIQWTDATFNPWRGCTKVSPGCANCYADALSKRNPKVLGVWGDNGTRVVAAESYWLQPLRWERAAAAAGKRRRVFCASLADVFEDWRGPMEDSRGVQLWKRRSGEWTTSDHYPHTVALKMDDVRSRLWWLIHGTPHLDWLLLTKRPENAQRWIQDHLMPPNVWLGASVEDQKTADERIPILLRTPAVVRWVSCEPLLRPVDLNAYMSSLDWVVVGGEGNGGREFHLDWARDVVIKGRVSGTPVFVKQLGSNPRAGAFRLNLLDPHGGDMDEWPEELRVREFPAVARSEAARG